MTNTDGVTCHECGHPGMTEEVAPQTHRMGKREVRIEDDRHLRCPECAAVRYEGAMLGEMQRKVAAAIREADGLLTPEELSAVRKKYGFTQEDMERLLSIGPKTWTRWERGKVVQTAAADRLIRIIARNPDALRELMRDRGVHNTDAERILADIEAEVTRRVRAYLREKFADLPAEVLDEMARVWGEEYRNARRHSAEGRMG